MALLDIFKKKKKEEKIEKKEKKEIEEKEKKEKEEAEKPSKKILEKKERKFQEAWRILKAPHITEKATKLTEKNQYVFKVFPNANKTEIKKAIESLYGVDVINVKIINIPKKERRLGRITGWRKGYKKAIVRIKEGQKIEVLPR
jgi:large subunit ribosomal protein L23